MFTAAPWETEGVDVDDSVAETAKRIATLSPEELLELRAELADIPPGDPYVDHDRAAMEHFDCMADREYESIEGIVAATRRREMPRPPADRIEEGFHIWSTEAERNDTKTAELMGLSQSTISYWHRTYGWDERYLALIQPQVDIMVGVTLAAIRAGLPTLTHWLLHIATATKPVFDAEGNMIGEVYASQDRDAIQAAKLLAQYSLTDRVYDGLPVSIEAQV